MKNYHRSVIYLIVLLTGTLNSDLLGQDPEINQKNIAFIEYPGFPEGHSTWNDIGYNARYNSVYIGVTNHHDKVGLYEYHASENEMELHGFIDEMAHLRPFQWQGKIHSKFIAGPNGTMYFSTDGGESREEYLMNHPHGYGGGFFMKWEPSSGQLTNLGMGLRYESIKDIDIDPETGIIYGITYPQAHFLVYDPAENNLRDMGRLASSHVPRVLFTDWWGNCYYVDWRQRLVKYDKEKGAFLFADESLPAFPNTPGAMIITGITAYAKDKENKVIYLVTYGAKVLAFYPSKEGIGRVEDLGGVIDTGNDAPWEPYVPNLNIGDNGKLYYIIGGHGNFVKKDKTLFVELDPESGERSVLFEYPVSKITEATGSDTKDKEGNLYFAGRKDIRNGPDSVPFLIKFNPEKEVEQ